MYSVKLSVFDDMSIIPLSPHPYLSSRCLFISSFTFRQAPYSPLAVPIPLTKRATNTFSQRVEYYPHWCLVNALLERYKLSHHMHFHFNLQFSSPLFPYLQLSSSWLDFQRCRDQVGCLRLLVCDALPREPKSGFCGAEIISTYTLSGSREQRNQPGKCS